MIKDQTYFTASICGELVGCGGWSHRTTLYGGDQRPVDQTQQFQEAYNSETAKNIKSILPTSYPADSAHTSLAANTSNTSNTARIRAFFVSPRYSRQGVAYALFDACQAAAQVQGFQRLELMATLPGVPFYAALGFKKIDDVIDLLPNGVALAFVRMDKIM